MSADRNLADHPICCPHDQVTMERVAVGVFSIDRCPTCGGVWLDRHEINAIIDAASSSTTIDIGPVRGARRRHSIDRPHCPRDNSPLIEMVDKNQPHVGVDACTVCGGVYLDAGELKDLSVYTLRERLRHVLPGLG